MKTSRAVPLLALLAVSSVPLLVDAQNSQQISTASVVRQTPDAAGLNAKPVPIAGIRLLTPSDGWISVNNRLLITRDSGSHWKEITPPGSPTGFQQVASISIENFWLLYVDPTENDRTSGSESPSDWEFRVAHTTDGGVTWLQTKVHLLKSADPPSGRAYLSFCDPLHGWLMYGLTTGTAFSSGFLLETSDGGRTWKQASGGPNFMGELMAVSVKSIWALGGTGGGDQLAVSRDGAKKFHPISIVAPPGVMPYDTKEYNLPIFTNDLEGYVAISFSNDTKSSSDQVLYKTMNGGLTWTPSHILTAVPHTGPISSTFVGSSWLLPVRTGSAFNVRRVDSDSPQNLSSPNLANCRLSFATLSVGWMDCGTGLLSTSDGGSTWKNVYP